MKKCLCIKENKIMVHFSMSKMYHYKIASDEEKKLDDINYMYPYKVYINDNYATAILFSKKQFKKYFKDEQEIRKQKLQKLPNHE